MKQRQLNTWITALVTVIAFLSVTYTACKKDTVTTTPNKCTNVVCQNNGSCYNGECTCALGFEGYDCSIKTTAKYAGTWDVVDSVVASSDTTLLHTAHHYTFQIKQSPSSNIRFLIDNFLGNSSYNNVSCVMTDALVTHSYTPNNYRYDGQPLGDQHVLIVDSTGTGTFNDNGNYLTSRFTTLTLVPQDTQGRVITTTYIFVAQQQQ